MRTTTTLQNAGGALLVVAALLVAACAPKSPEERISRARGRYTAKLNAFIVQETPVGGEEATPAEPGEAAEEAAEAEPPAASAGDETAAAADAEPVLYVQKNVELDLLVQHDLDKALPGITVDVTMVAADKTEKGAWKVWVETAGLPKANQKQISYILEDVDYEEGDGFSADIRHPIPPAERGDYREFQEAAGGG